MTSLHGEAKLRELMNSPLGEASGQISADGRLIAYAGWESGRRGMRIVHETKGALTKSMERCPSG